MGNARRIAALGVAVAAVTAGLAASPVSANNGQGNGSQKLIPLQILSFNDYHGHLDPPAGTDATLGAALDPSGTLVGGSEYLSTKLTELRQGVEHSLTAAAGDLIGGSPFLSGLFHDEPSVETLEAMKLDVSSVGNHEFDEGLDRAVPDAVRRVPSRGRLLLPRRALRRRGVPVAGRQRDVRGDRRDGPAAHVDQSRGGREGRLHRHDAGGHP